MLSKLLEYNCHPIPESNEGSVLVAAVLYFTIATFPDLYLFILSETKFVPSVPITSLSMYWPSSRAILSSSPEFCIDPVPLQFSINVL